MRRVERDCAAWGCARRLWQQDPLPAHQKPKEGGLGTGAGPSRELKKTFSEEPGGFGTGGASRAKPSGPAARCRGAASWDGHRDPCLPARSGGSGSRGALGSFPAPVSPRGQAERWAGNGGFCAARTEVGSAHGGTPTGSSSLKSVETRPWHQQEPLPALIKDPKKMYFGNNPSAVQLSTQPD